MSANIWLHAKLSGSHSKNTNAHPRLWVPWSSLSPSPAPTTLLNAQDGILGFPSLSSFPLLWPYAAQASLGIVAPYASLFLSQVVCSKLVVAPLITAIKEFLPSPNPLCPWVLSTHLLTMMTFWSWVILSSVSGTMVAVSTVRRVASGWSKWLPGRAGALTKGQEAFRVENSKNYLWEGIQGTMADHRFSFSWHPIEIKPLLIAHPVL